MENCFVHGSSSAEIRHIYLRIRKTERFAIEVQNTGSFLEAEKETAVNRKIAEGTPDNESIGLCNIRKRLNLLYGEKGRYLAGKQPGERGSGVYLFLALREEQRCVEKMGCCFFFLLKKTGNCGNLRKKEEKKCPFVNR